MTIRKLQDENEIDDVNSPIFQTIKRKSPYEKEKPQNPIEKK